MNNMFGPPQPGASTNAWSLVASSSTSVPSAAAQNVARAIASEQSKVTALINEAMTQHRTGRKPISSSGLPLAAGSQAGESGNTLTVFGASLAACPLLVWWPAASFAAREHPASAPRCRKGCAMSDMIPERERYFQLVEEARRLLESQLDRIWNDSNEGTITVREAADARIQVMTEHLNRLKQLRDEFLS